MVPDCKKCSLSWPKDDPLGWKSDNSKCRCNTNDAPSVFQSGDKPPAPKGPIPAADLAWGEPCPKLTDGDCPLVKGCATCTWSWPKNDPKTWNSNDAKCRCNTGKVESSLQPKTDAPAPAPKPAAAPAATPEGEAKK